MTRKPCNYNMDYAYANGFPLVAKGLDMDIPMTSATNGNMSFGGGEFGCWMDVWGFEPRVAWSRQLNVSPRGEIEHLKQICLYTKRLKFVFRRNNRQLTVNRLRMLKARRVC